MIEKELREYIDSILQVVIKCSEVDISTEMSQNTKLAEHAKPRQVYQAVLHKMLYGIIPILNMGEMEHRQFDHATILHSVKLIKMLKDVGGDDQTRLYDQVLNRIKPFAPNAPYQYKCGDHALSLKHGKTCRIIEVDSLNNLRIQVKDTRKKVWTSSAYLIPKVSGFYIHTKHVDKDDAGRFVSKNR